MSSRPLPTLEEENPSSSDSSVRPSQSASQVSAASSARMSHPAGSGDPSTSRDSRVSQSTGQPEPPIDSTPADVSSDSSSSSAMTETQQLAAAMSRAALDKGSAEKASAARARADEELERAMAESIAAHEQYEQRKRHLEQEYLDATEASKNQTELDGRRQRQRLKELWRENEAVWAENKRTNEEARGGHAFSGSGSGVNADAPARSSVVSAAVSGAPRRNSSHTSAATRSSVSSRLPPSSWSTLASVTDRSDLQGRSATPTDVSSSSRRSVTASDASGSNTAMASSQRRERRLSRDDLAPDRPPRSFQSTPSLSAALDAPPVDSRGDEPQRSVPPSYQPMDPLMHGTLQDDEPAHEPPRGVPSARLSSREQMRDRSYYDPAVWETGPRSSRDGQAAESHRSSLSRMPETVCEEDDKEA